MIDVCDIWKAERRIHKMIRRTPVMTSTTLDKMLSAEIFFKCENFQRAGAFKFRGVANCLSLLSEEQRNRGVITHSSGNHAQALALAAKMSGVPAVVVMPRTAARVKIDATRGYGAEVVFCEPTLESRESVTQRLIEKYGYTLIHPYNDERIIAGAGTAALELLEEVDDLDCVLAPVGGGGLLSGTSLAVKGICPECVVLGVEPRGADDAYRSLATGVIQPSINPNTIADGLRTSLGSITFPIIRQNVDGILTVTDRQIVDAMRLLWERMKLVVEPSGAVPLAGILSNRDQFRDRRVGVILSGGNVDLSVFFEQYASIRD